MGRADWQFYKAETKATRGVVVAKHPLAAQAGLEVLRRGGNAVDAAVTTALAVGVVEPEMSGLGGGGYLVYYQASTGKVFVVNYAMRAPQSARPDFYELEEGRAVNLFAWRKVKNDANIRGVTSVAVPGTVAGLSLALQRFGSGEISWAEALAPAIKFAGEGFEIDWYTFLRFAMEMDLLRRYPDTAAVLLPDGLTPIKEGKPGAKPLRQTALAGTLRRLASEGPDYFYKGEMARWVAEYVQRQGGLLSEADLARYQARVEEPLSFEYNGYQLFTANGPTGGPTLAEHLQICEALQPGDLSDPETWHRRIEAARLAWADRFEYLADSEVVPVPLSELTSRDYAKKRAGEVHLNGEALPYPAPAGQLTRPDNPMPAYGPKAGESTTHLIVVDAEHNMVTLTQTLLSLFGSGVLEPKSGLLLNNGLMWFDPEPGRANSLGPDRRPLTNMTPTLVLKDNKPLLAIGASGGRRIPNAIAQVFLGVAHGVEGTQAALDLPRFEAGQPDRLEIEARVGPQVTEELVRRGHPLVITEEDPVSLTYASPLMARVEEDGTLSAGSERWHSGRAEGL